MRFIEVSRSLVAADIVEVEGELDVTLPVQFTSHYLQYNGGYPEFDKFNWPNGKKTAINAFASIKEKGFVSLEEMYQDLVKNESYLPDKIVPFATDDGGNMFCISCRERDYGFIYYCDNEHYDLQDKEKSLICLDTSFNHFVESLTA